MIWITVLILAVSFCVWSLLKYIIWLIRAINMTANIPGPKPLPIIGNALIFAKISTQEELLSTVLSLFKEHSTHDGIVKLWLGAKPMILLANPKYAEILLSSQHAVQKDDIYKHIGLAGNGVFVRNGQEWQELRKPLDKFLTKKMIESNLDVFHEKALKLWNMLNKYADTRTVINLREYMTNYSFDVLCLTNFGHNLNVIENEQYNLVDTLHGMEDIVLKMMIKIPYNVCLPYAKLSMAGRRLKKLCKIFWNLSHELLEGRLRNKKLLEEENDANSSFYSDVLLQKALKDKLSWEDTGRLVTDYLIAGFDTSAATLSYMLLFLAMYPEHQEAVYQEQLDICGDDPEVVPTWEQLSKMDYLTRVMKEVWRLCSAVGIVRKLTNDINLVLELALGDIDNVKSRARVRKLPTRGLDSITSALPGDYKIPKGFAVYIMLNTLHRNPKTWSHPSEFYPDHFQPEEAAKRPKGSYLPFSLGPRSCPGGVYATMSIKTVVSVAVRKYKLETDLQFEKLEYKYCFLLEPIQSYLVRIRNRK